MKYALMKDSEVDFETWKAANMALASVRKELKLPMVKIKWFEHIQFVKNPTEIFEHDQDIRGLYEGKTPDTIYIRAGQFPESIKETVCHETFHLWQFLQGGGIKNEWTEDLANGYAANVMQRMVNDSEKESVYLDHMVGKDWASERNRKEMDRRLGKPKAGPASKPKLPQPVNQQSGRLEPELSLTDKLLMELLSQQSRIKKGVRIG